MIRGNLDKAILDNKFFIKRWVEEDLTNQINWLKSILFNNQRFDNNIVSLCGEILDHCLEEYKFRVNCSERQLTIRILFGFEHIQRLIAFIVEMTRTWGELENYFLFLIDVTKELRRIINASKRSNRDWIDFTDAIFNRMNHYDRIEQKIASLTLIEDLTRDCLEKNLGSRDLFDLSLLESQKRYREELSSFEFGKKVLKFETIRTDTYKNLKYFSRLIIPTGLRRLNFERRNNDKFFEFLIKECLTILNNYCSYAGTRRYRFRLGESHLIKLVRLINISPHLTFLELFGNVPILSWVLTFLGLTVTSIDFHFTQKQGSVSNLVEEAFNSIKKGDIIRFRQILKDFEKLEGFGEVIEPDIASNQISSVGTLKIISWLHPEIIHRYNPLSLDISDLEGILKGLPKDHYDRIFIDPPYGIETSYLSKKLRLLIENSIEIVRICGKTDSIKCISIPDLRRRRKEREAIRNEILGILEDKKCFFTPPGVRRRFLFFSFH